MEQTLQQFLSQGVFAFMLTFVRIGSAIIVMPGLGDSFTPRQIRLYIALGLTLVLAPFVAPMLPQTIPQTGALLVLIGMEFVIGIFFGTIARIFMTALDTAGMLISTQSGLGSAQLFNPAFSTQGSLIGTFLTISGMLVMFAANFHHLLFYGLVGSYEMFPVGEMPAAKDMAEAIANTIGRAFLIGVEISAPFIVITMLLFIGMGVLSRLMPAIQVFTIALPLQILLSLITLSLVLSASLLYWLSTFEDGMVGFLKNGQ